MKNLARIVVTSLSLMLFAGCASNKGTTPSTLNTKCVLSGEALTASSPTVDYKGGKLGFCCDKCIAKWNTMDDAAKKTAFDAKK